ncbi:MAG: beta-eliminating lyase-related protein [Gammaproteobacteria bacterium]|nr:beta-eliminating lyase-related protein [Gammaproteobacteria bacterium]
MIDLRSDTVTKPTQGMLEAMFSAKVGDDVFDEDPTVIELEKKAADCFGMEKAIFCPSGTMTNQIAIKLHVSPGDEVICSSESHIYRYEGGGIAFNSSASVRLISGWTGLITAEQVIREINQNNIHFPVTRLVSLENTSNRGGGCCYDIREIEAIHEVCKSRKLKLHLDGARLFNAIIANKENPRQYGKLFDSVSLCFSKGLGAPVGSVLMGTREDILRAKRIRKVLGGGMRQAGFLAAAASYALDHHIVKLERDHKNAERIGLAAKKNKYVKEVLPVETNIVVLVLKETIANSVFISKLKDANVNTVDFGHQRVRLVTHLGLTDEDIITVEQALVNMS